MNRRAFLAALPAVAVVARSTPALVERCDRIPTLSLGCMYEFGEDEPVTALQAFDDDLYIGTTKALYRSSDLTWAREDGYRPHIPRAVEAGHVYGLSLVGDNLMVFFKQRTCYIEPRTIIAARTVTTARPSSRAHRPRRPVSRRRA